MSTRWKALWAVRPWMCAWVALGTLTVSAAAQLGDSLLERPARLEVEEVGLEEALRALQRASGVQLAFSPDLLPDRLVSCRCEDATVGEALEQLLAETGLVYEASQRQVLIGRRDGTPEALVGRVVEAGVGRPVPAAEVSVTGGGGSTLTDDAGRFVLRGLNGGEHTLLVSSLGYETRTVDVSGAGPVRVELEPRPIALESVVIAPGRLAVLEIGTPLSGVAVSRDDIEAIPQFGDDVFRTLKRMPGVAAEDISTKLNVRGGTDRDLLVRLDGLELHEPYHLKDLDGALGIVDVQSLGGIDLVTGGFPAEYGDKTAGVFNMYSRTPPPSGTRTTLGMSLSSLSAISQGSFADGRGQWLGSLRRGFLEYVLSVSGVDDEMDPTFWDALGRVHYLVNDRHSLWAQVLYAGDDLAWSDEATASRVVSRWTNGYAWGGWKARLGERLRIESMLSVGRLTRERIGDVDNPNGGAFTPLTADITDVGSFDFGGVKLDGRVDLTDDVMFKLGADLRSGTTEYDYFAATTRFGLDEQNRLVVLADTTTTVASPNGSEVAAYAALRGRAAGRLFWEVGARYDWHEHTDDESWSPRLLARIDLDPRTSLKASWGRYHQSQGLHELNARDGERVFARSERAEQIAVGLERAFAGGLSVRLEAYRRGIRRPLPMYVNLSREVNPILEVEADRARLEPSEARARGIELTLARDGAGRFDGSLGYALSRSEDRVEGRWAPRTLDQLHTVVARGAYRIGDAWQLSGSWSYHTGWPFTEQFLNLETGVDGDGNQEILFLERGFGEYNAQRLPAYHRLDLRVTRAFVLERSRLEVYLDVFNAYNRTNLRGYQWTLRGRDGTYRAHRSSGEEQLPILPTLGFRWVF